MEQQDFPATHEPTPEMVRFFDERTRRHIELVQMCMHKIAPKTEHEAELLERAKVHDQSKYSDEEWLPYVWHTESHRCRQSGELFHLPDGMKERIRGAIQHHFSSNRHHPGFHREINDMTEVDLIEMVCDWTAMAIEMGGDSARAWADKKVGSHYPFNKEKQKFIYDVIGLLER